MTGADRSEASVDRGLLLKLVRMLLLWHSASFRLFASALLVVATAFVLAPPVAADGPSAGTFTYDDPVGVAQPVSPELARPDRSVVDLSVSIAGRNGGLGHVNGSITIGVAPSASPWDLGWSSRGLAIEEALGGNLPRSFPTIDRFANGTATSIKSIDLTASSYQSTSALTSRLSGYVDKVAGFNGATFSGTRITSGQITGRELVVAVQPGAATSAQQGVLSSVIQYGANNGVTVRVVAVP